MSAEEFVGRKFHEYYGAHFVSEPLNIERREFGFGVFGKKISERHFAFKSLQDFNHFLRDQVPFYASCSPAHYEFPDAQPMSAKRLIGGDLLWEFDADDFKTPCAEGHTLWKCPKCSLSGTGRQQYCTSCGEKTAIEEWVCPECLDAVKKQTLELLKTLQDDFGISEGLSVNFSGSKGFHVHLRSESYFKIPQAGRVEMLNYLTGHELDLKELGFLSGKRALGSVALKPAKGWQSKVLESAISFLEKCTAFELHSLTSLREKEAATLLESREKIIEGLREGRLFEFGKKSPEFWKAVLEKSAEGHKLKIDRQTSIDIAKIVRVPETLHGSTGLLAKKFAMEELAGFDALKESIVFSTNPVRVFVERTPRFCVGGEWFEAMEQKEIELPEFAAVFLLARNSARLAEK